MRYSVSIEVIPSHENENDFISFSDISKEQLNALIEICSKQDCGIYELSIHEYIAEE